ncbi:hypothetical protein [Hydrotalea sp.]|uniref:hypothetical protein n=1 Tax=Hydrotalea sp. TaxID=2881279 RepID=UPI00261CC881|nr:hypothetical protein [Hydrotalea sp.]
MKKIATIFLMLIFLFGSTEAYQLLKLPLLVQHYIQHRSEDPGISFIAFLKIHYNKKLVIDDDWQQDQQLPFKTQQSANAFMFGFVSMPSHPISVQCIPPPFVQKTFRIEKNPEYSFTLLQDIFQPPRLA